MINFFRKKKKQKVNNDKVDISVILGSGFGNYDSDNDDSDEWDSVPHMRRGITYKIK